MDQKINALEKEHDMFSVLILDIDHFKQVNDQHGHLLGDRILQQFGQLIRNQIRGEDLGIRFGGEEFIVILPSTSIEGAIKVAHNIRNQRGAQGSALRTSGNTRCALAWAGRIMGHTYTRAHAPLAWLPDGASAQGLSRRL